MGALEKNVNSGLIKNTERKAVNLKRYFALFVVIFSILCFLFSCGDNNEPDRTEGTKENDAIFGDGKEPVLITNADLSNGAVSSAIYSITDAVNKSAFISVPIHGDYAPKADNEIVIGETERAVSKAATEKLTAKLKRAAEANANKYSDEQAAIEDTVGFAIYAEGGSVAVVWSDGHLFENAIEFFVKNYVASASLKLNDGYIRTEVFSLNEFLEERGNRIREEQFTALEKAIGGNHGTEIVASLKQLYTIYKPEAVTWLANLYDPDTGGFYYSNSARDNLGFLPDIESTYGALAFVEETGMAELYGNDYSKALPKWLLDGVGAWIRDLQEEDGYFYHPQWPKSFINERGLQSRITRDKGSAVSILRRLGIQEAYPASAALTDGLSDGGGKVSAVSRVIATKGVLSQFESVEAFRNYINDLDAEVLAISNPNERAGRLYAIGNEFQSTVSLVKKNPEFVKILHAFFKKHQDPTTGTWSTVLTFNATNSLHKIGYVYNSLGLKYDYLYEMIDTVITILSRDVDTDPISTGVDFANAWASIEHIYTNIRRCSSDAFEAEQKLREVKEYVYANIKKAIDATFSQLGGFVQHDGSIGYSRRGSSYTSQGCPAAVPGSAEGDVNGYGCASYSITGYIALALDLPEYEVKIFGEKERVEFVRTLERLGNVVKREEEIFPDVTITFSDGTLPEEITVALNEGNVITPGASVEVEKINGNNVLRVVAVSKNGKPGLQNPSIVMPVNLTHPQANAAVIEFDLCVFDEGSSTHARMIEWAQRSNGNLVNYPTIGKTATDKVVLYNSEGGVITELCEVDEEVNISFVYFWAEGEYKVYVNGSFKAKGSAIYSQTMKNMPLTETSFYSPTSMYANYYIDNLRLSRVQKYYDPNETVQYPKQPVTEDFEGELTSTKYGEGYNVTTEKGFSALYSDKYTNIGGATAVIRTDDGNGNKFLSIYAPKRANSEYSHVLKAPLPTQMAEDPNVYVFEASLKLNSISTSRNFLQFTFLNTTGSYRYGQLNSSSDGNVMLLGGVPIGYYDQWFNFKLEYYLDRGIIKIFSDGRLMGEITEFSQSDDITSGSVASLTHLTDFSLGTMNSGGSLSFSIDNVALYTTAIEYTEGEADGLPEPTPDRDDFLPEVVLPSPDPEPKPEPEPEPGGDDAPEVDFPGMEPPMEFPDGIAPTPPDLGDGEDMGDWTEV